MSEPTLLKNQIVINMKTYIILFTILVLGCSTVKMSNQNSNAYYFYFEKTNGKMRSYHNVKKQKKSYTYLLDNAASILFYVKKNENEFKIKTIKPKDTIGLGVKTYDWMNRFDNFSLNSFLYRKPHKSFFIIEKGSLKNNKLNLIEVIHVDETE